MLGRSHRFHGYGVVNGVYRRGQTVRGSVVSLKYARRNPDKAYRVAVVVSRKVHKSAVVRNRIRRRIYEIIRRADVPPGTDLVVTVYSEQAATMETSRLQAAVAELLHKIAA